MVKFWKKLKYWQIGGFIGIIVSVLTFFFNYLSINFLSRIFLFLPREILVDKFNFSVHYCDFICGAIADVIIANILLYPLLGFLVGLLIGLIKKNH